MRIQLNPNSVEPLGISNMGLSTEQGDSWNSVISSINAMTGDLYNANTATFRNLLDGGDFTTNPWQRGTTFTGIAATAVYTADRFFVAGTDASVSAKAAQVSVSGAAAVQGFGTAFRFGRANTASSLSAIVVGQIGETADSIRLQGQTVTLSFWAASEANFSAGSLGVQMIQGGGTDQSAASALAGTWTGQSNVISSLQAVTAAPVRYSFSGTLSASATQVGVLLRMTPVGSAGSADSVLIQGIQLEVGSGPSNFEHRDVGVELALCQRYCYVVREQFSGIAIAPAVAVSTDKYGIIIPTPVPMRIAPTVVVTNGSFGFQRSGTYLAGTNLSATGAAASTHTVYAIAVTQNATAVSNLNAVTFVSGSGIGVITASAEY